MAAEKNSQRSSIGAGGLLVLVLGGFGCSSGAQVSGKVTLDGQPVGGAQVIFVCEDKGAEATIVARTDDAGSYNLIANTPAGIAVGKYKVAVTKEALKDGSVPQGEQLEQARAGGKLMNILPKVYADRATTPLQFDLRGGANTIPLELKKKP